MSYPANNGTSRCYHCGDVNGFVSGNDGYYYCIQCHVQNPEMMDMMISPEDIYTIYKPKFFRRRRCYPASALPPVTISQPPKPPVHTSPPTSPVPAPLPPPMPRLSRFAPARRSVPGNEVSRRPEVKWAQRVDTVIITVCLFDPSNPKIDLSSDGTFTFSAKSEADQFRYELKLSLYGKVNVDKEIETKLDGRSVQCMLEKAEKGWWKKLVSDQNTPYFVKVDWDKWVHEDKDEDVNSGDADLNPEAAIDAITKLGKKISREIYEDSRRSGLSMISSTGGESDEDDDEVSGASASPPRKCMKI